MRVILVRHGKASKDPKYTHDEERPLTGRGKAEVTALAEWLGRAGITVHQIRHSGLLRAQQTAEIFARHLKPAGGVIAVSGLLFDDPVDHLPGELALEASRDAGGPQSVHGTAGRRPAPRRPSATADMVRHQQHRLLRLCGWLLDSQVGVAPRTDRRGQQRQRGRLKAPPPSVRSRMRAPLPVSSGSIGSGCRR